MNAAALQGLIFDVDGTLADTEPLHCTAFNEAFARAGLDWHWDAPTYLGLLAVAGGKERIAHWQRTQRTPGEAEWTARTPEVAALHQAKTAIYTGLVERGEIRLREGVEPLLREARAGGLRLAIATTTTPANIDALLTSTLGRDWRREFFEVVEDAQTAPHLKPDPLVYRQALARLGLPAEACVAFEDSINGLRASLAAGLATVVTPSHFTQDQDFRGALRVMPSLRDVRLERLLEWRQAIAA